MNAPKIYELPPTDPAELISRQVNLILHLEDEVAWRNDRIEHLMRVNDRLARDLRSERAAHDATSRMLGGL